MNFELVLHRDHTTPPKPEFVIVSFQDLYYIGLGIVMDRLLADGLVGNLDEESHERFNNPQFIHAAILEALLEAEGEDVFEAKDNSGAYTNFDQAVASGDFSIFNRYEVKLPYSRWSKLKDELHHKFASLISLQNQDEETIIDDFSDSDWDFD